MILFRISWFKGEQEHGIEDASSTNEEEAAEETRAILGNKAPPVVCVERIDRDILDYYDAQAVCVPGVRGLLDPLPPPFASAS